MSIYNILLGVLLIFVSIPLIIWSIKKFRKETIGYGGNIKVFIGSLGLFTIGIVLVIRELLN